MVCFAQMDVLFRFVSNSCLKLCRHLAPIKLRTAGNFSGHCSVHTAIQRRHLPCTAVPASPLILPLFATPEKSLRKL